MELIREAPPPVLAEHGIEFFPEAKPVGVTAHMHIHPAIEFIYIMDGLFNIEVERQVIRARAGDLVLFHSNAVHMLENVGDGIGLYYVLKMSPTFLFGMFDESSIAYIRPFLNSRTDDIRYFPAADQPPAFSRLWQAMIAEYTAGEPSFFAMQRLLACEFLLACARFLLRTRATAPAEEPALSERSVRLISESLNYINEHFATPLTAVGCASLAHLSYNHYAKLFRAVTGKTFKEYLTDLRMARAYNMLLFSTQPVYEIGVACGYDNFSYFIVEFKKKYGCPPGQFRKSAYGANEP